MVKCFRLFAGHCLGFWALGLLLFALQEVPYMVMPLFKLDSNPIMTMKESSAFLEACEKLLGSACVALMIFVVGESADFFSVGSGWQKAGFILAAAVLLLNYAGWGIYFSGHQTLFVMLFFIVALPPLFYVFVGLWRKNILLMSFGAVFGIVHFLHVYGNLTQ